MIAEKYKVIKMQLKQLRRIKLSVEERQATTMWSLASGEVFIVKLD